MLKCDNEGSRETMTKFAQARRRGIASEVIVEKEETAKPH